MNEIQILKKEIASHEQRIAQLEQLLLQTKGEWGSLQDILQTTANKFGVTPEAIKSPVRRAKLVSARTAYIKAARQRGYSLVAIADFIHKDHASISYLLYRTENRLQNFPEHREQMAFIINQY